MKKIIFILSIIGFSVIPFADQKIVSFIPLYPLDVIFALILIISLLHLWQMKEFPMKVSLFVCLSLTLFCMSAILSFFLHNPDATGLGQLKSWIVLPALATFFGASIFSSEKNRDHCMLIAWGAGIIVLLAVILPYIFSGIRTFDGRLQGPFRSPNFLAFYLFPSALIGWYFLKRTSSSPVKGALLFGIFFSVLVIFLTQSLGGLLALSASILFFIVRYNYSEQFKSKNIPILLIVLFFLSITTIQLEKVSHLFEERSSLSSRLTIWQVATRAIYDSPIFGIGIGKFQEVYLTYQSFYPPYLEWAVPQPHNLWLALWLQTGFVGVIVIVFLLFKIGVISRESVITSETRIIFESLLVGQIVYGLFDTPLFGNALALLWWAVLALLLFPLKKEVTKKALSLSKGF